MIAGLDGYSESDNLTADGGGKDSNSASTTDGGSAGGDVEVVQLSDSSTINVLEGGDGEIPRDTGPASDAMCALTKNGSGCNHDPRTCCSSTCDETGKCTGLACATDMMACKNGLNAVYGLHLYPDKYRAQGNCCVNEFCSPNGGTATDGTCQKCVASGLTPPQRAVAYKYLDPGNMFKPTTVNVPVQYDDGCCSGGLDNAGNCK